MIKDFIKNNRILALKKACALFLLLFGMLFVFLNRDIYYSLHVEAVSQNADSPEAESLIRFSGSRTFEQPFQGWDGTLELVTIRFFNHGNSLSSGSVAVNILDANGNTLMSTEKALTSISRRSPFAFANPQKLSQNNTYLLQVIVRDAYNPQGFGIYTHSEKGGLFGTLTQDQTPIDNRLRASFNYSFYNIRAVIDMYVLLFLSLLFVLIPFWRIDAIIKEKFARTIDSTMIVSRIFFWATPVLCVFLGDRFNDYHLSEMLERIFTWQFLFNLSIYILLLLIAYMLINRTQYASILVLFLAFLMHIANYYVWIFRGCPILATDVQSAATAFNVADNFSYTLDMTGIWGVVYILSFTAVFLSLRGYKGPRLKRRLCIAAACAAYAFLFIVLFVHTDFIPKRVEHKIWHPQRSYAKNGNALSFMMSWSSIRIEKPKNYSVKEVEKIAKDYPSDKASEADAKANGSPNIIAIMNESLADLNYNNPVNLSEDYLPFLHSLKENTVKGKLYVSIEGANTANTEFEFLTGNTLGFLPYHCVPYNEYIRDVLPSMAHSMKTQGYAGVNAFHPYRSSGWSRTIVYPLLGFNDCFFQEYYQENNNYTLLRNYISDKSDFQQIIDDYEAAKKENSAPFYLFNVTMQNHGGYSGKAGVVEPKITINDPALNTFEAQQYVNLAKISDDAFKELVEYFKEIDDPTIIVMFGDHQPPLPNTFYSNQFGKDVEELSTEEKADWYSTPYVIWANYDIEEKELDMSANYLSSYVMKIAGNKLTGYNKFLLELQNEFPVISAVCYKDKDGNIYSIDEKAEDNDLLTSYQMLQYNQMFDTDNRVDSFFFLK